MVIIVYDSYSFLVFITKVAGFCSKKIYIHSFIGYALFTNSITFAANFQSIYNAKRSANI